MTKYLSAALLTTFAMLQLQGQQLEITAGYLSQSEFADHQKISHGKGELYRIGLKYNQPLYAKQNENGDPTLWTMAIQGHLYDLRGTDEAAKQNPDDILNASANVTHIRPISEKWSIIATLGVGIYSAPDEISWSSLLANGGCLFIYKASSTFSIGGGIGLTNAYGAPMVVPMTYLKWNPKGRFEFDLNISNGIKASIQTQFGQNFKLRWHLLDMEGVTSVVKMNGKNKLYSSMMLSSFLTPSFHFSKKLSIFIDAGVNMVRTCKVTDRKIKYLFGGQKDEDKRHFRPAGKLGVGIKYDF